MSETKTRLSVERTFSSWTRTGLALLAIGALAAEQVVSLEPVLLWKAIGLVFIATSTIIFIYSFVEYFLAFRRLQAEASGETEGMPVWLMGLISILMIGASGLIFVIAAFL